jgi:hypothetical protein
MDQPSVEIYVVQCARHARKRIAAVLPQTLGEPPAARPEGFAPDRRFSMLQGRRSLYRPYVADLTFAGHPAARRFRMDTSEQEHQGFAAKGDWT